MSAQYYCADRSVSQFNALAWCEAFMREECKRMIIDEFGVIIEFPSHAVCMQSGREPQCKANPTGMWGLFNCCPATDAAEPPEECRFAIPFVSRYFCKCPLALQWGFST